MKFRFSAITVLAAAVLALVGMGSTASAVPRDHADPTSYAAQARSLGLTTGQADQLQARVDREARQTGGRQVAVNEVQYDGGATVLTLPGQKYARSLGSVTPASGTLHRCPPGYFCIYTAVNYQGNMHMLYHCNTYYLTPYVWASYLNNQTAGVKARYYAGHTFYGFSRAAVSSEPAAPEGDTVTSIMPCYRR
ncbi:peptidase inhibitor family I36 protein [Microlunatus soli]|uniref:Peptidase inhibitor family I36 n=1 Tax=Microlunatus soli TaxID=630515 RepID=A0A1H1UVA3_9ACTN|nr:peptidase inhibitor family I36 protein [Microlunatus soli]SDS76026.1 Peptidase inhibitor family I36 [Microlunatus soli]